MSESEAETIGDMLSSAGWSHSFVRYVDMETGRLMCSVEATRDGKRYVAHHGDPDMAYKQLQRKIKAGEENGFEEDEEMR